MDHFRNNNLDIIRLFAALQVMMAHSLYYFKIDGFSGLIKLFPGVPIFFFISGFLIAQSWCMKHQISDGTKIYCLSRFLRVFPALWVCLCISLFLIYLSEYEGVSNASSTELGVFFASSLVALTYTPGFLENYGTGSFNGSLWTIAVELQFYILIPFITRYFKDRHLNFLLLIVVFILVSIYCVNSGLSRDAEVKITFFPWIYMFLIGNYFYFYKEYLLKLVKKIPMYFLIFVYILSNIFFSEYGSGVEISPIVFLSLIILIFKLGFCTRLHIRMRHDISYGIYIYHIPVINYLLEVETIGVRGFISAYVITFILAVLSWCIVEKNVLKLRGG